MKKFKKNQNNTITQRNTEWLTLYGTHISAILLYSITVILLINSFSPIHTPEINKYGLFHLPLITLINLCLFLIIGGWLLFVKKGEILFTIYSILWTGLSIANNFLIESRGTPLTKYDFSTMFNGGLNIASQYLETTHYITIAGFIILSILLILLSIKLSHKNINLNKIKYLITYIIIFVIFISLNLVTFNKNTTIEKYTEKGFVMAFSENLIQGEIAKPKEYSKKIINEIKDKIDNSYSIKEAKDTPNIIAIQLESFFDLKTIKGIELSENPTPYWDELSKNYSSGTVTVPTVGGATARSEFEFITSGSLSTMPSGIIPHETFLKRDEFFSNTHNLKNRGYSTHLLHNYVGNFYNRDTVYKNLGFDTFTSAELITYSTTDPGCVKASNDEVFPVHLKTIIRSSENKDFIFGITSELHGPYDGNYITSTYNISTNGFGNNSKDEVDEYANRLRDMDDVIKDIVTAVEEENEPSIIVFYSDHLPAFDYEKTNLNNDRKYEVPYLIWDNIGLKKEDKNLKLNELFSDVLCKANVEGNYLNKLQTSLSKDKNYPLYQEVLQYDLMFGRNYIKDTVSLKNNNTKIGHSNLLITNVTKEGSDYVFEGENFTNHTYLMVDNKKYNIICQNNNKLRISSETVNLDNKDVYLEIMIGDNKDSIAQSNIFNIK